MNQSINHLKHCLSRTAYLPLKYFSCKSYLWHIPLQGFLYILQDRNRLACGWLHSTEHWCHSYMGQHSLCWSMLLFEDNHHWFDTQLSQQLKHKHTNTTNTSLQRKPVILLYLKLYLLYQDNGLFSTENRINLNFWLYRSLKEHKTRSRRARKGQVSSCRNKFKLKKSRYFLH